VQDVKDLTQRLINAWAGAEESVIQYKYLKTYQLKIHCKGDSHSSKTANIIFARTYDKTKVNVLTSASEMVFKFMELHYVGRNNSSHPS